MVKMNHADKPEIYKVRLIDYALPGFCDGEVQYYGTAGNIRKLFERSLDGKGRMDAERYLSAMDEYLSGKGPGRVRIQYEEPRPLLSRTELLGRSAWGYRQHTFKFHNVWNVEDDITMDRVLVDAIYLEDPQLTENRFLRCVKLQITRPMTDDPFKGGRVPVVGVPGWFWGYPHMIEQAGGEVFFNRLHYPDHTFQTLAEAEQDMEQPSPVDFRRFFLEIYGDG